jgi:hypothetical protein
MMIIYKAGLSEAYEEDSYLEYFVNEEDAKKYSLSLDCGMYKTPFVEHVNLYSELFF